VNTLSEQIISEQRKEKQTDKKDDDDPDAGKSSNGNDATNRGKLIVNATCTPADIRYPTDVSLLNEAREKAEEMIDILFEPDVGKMTKPRTYRRKARKAFVEAIKKKHRKTSETRKAIGQQLRYLKRDLKIIKDLIARNGIRGFDGKNERT
jgi:IS5 family transposase